jgi:hypothetical protein
VARNSVHLRVFRVLPVTVKTIRVTRKALTMHLLGLCTPRSVILAIWAAVQNRRRTAWPDCAHPGHDHDPRPGPGPYEFSAWARALPRLRAQRPTDNLNASRADVVQSRRSAGLGRISESGRVPSDSSCLPLT